MNILVNCLHKKELAMILTEGLFGAISMNSKETKESNVFIMINDIMDDFKYDPVEVVTMAITDIRKGKRKIYGMVTPFDFREMITDNLELIAINRENEHNERKGHGEVEVSKRNSGRISDYFKILKK